MPRSGNMTSAEKSLLVDLCHKHADVIENKKTDFGSARSKAEGWRQLTAEFTATSVSAVARDSSQLKHVSGALTCTFICCYYIANKY
jgi:Myb/SANT-like DNA-binding domain